jgi:hypothetical protein
VPELLIVNVQWLEMTSALLLWTTIAKVLKMNFHLTCQTQGKQHIVCKWKVIFFSTANMKKFKKNHGTWRKSLLTVQKEHLIKNGNNIVNIVTGMHITQACNCNSVPSRSKRYFSSPRVYATFGGHLAILC